MPMHCSANVDDDGDAAVFFGLSAPARPRCRPTPRTLIGDDEHGWGEDGVFNFEGGCYAKTINLSRRSRAGDLRHHQALRHGAGERRLDPKTASARFRRWFADRKHPRAYPMITSPTLQ
jgi:hypothetical protein